MKISLVRGAFLNPFEIQNYYPLRDKYEIECVSSLRPLAEVELKTRKLFSLSDIEIPYKYQIFNRLFSDAHFLLGLEKAISGSDIAHVAETYFGFTKQAIVAKEKGLVKKVVSTCWEVIPHNNETLRGRRQIKEYCRDRIDHFLTPTLLAKQALIDEGVGEEKISVVPMGVQVEKYKRTKRTGDKIRVLFVGRLVVDKGADLFIEAAKKIREKFSDVEFVMIGKGPFETQARNNGVEVRSVSYDVMPLEYQNADIFCLPSQESKTWKEQYGMVFVEAMAAGLPIVTTGTGAIKEVCKDAAVYAKNTDLEGRLIRLIEDEKHREKLGLRASLRSVDFDVQRTSKMIEEVWLKVQ